MRSTADKWRFGALSVLFCGAIAFAGGPVGHGSAPGGHAGTSVRVASSPRIASGGYVNWHASSNTGMYPASWNVGSSSRGLRPRPIRPGGYGSGFGNQPGFGYNWRRRGAVAIVPFYPFYDSGGYYEDPGGPPPADTAGDYAPPPPADYPSSYGQSSYGPDAPPSYPAERAPVIQEQPVVNQPPITVVLQSGQQFVIQNYAVMNGMLWDFSKPAVRKIPLASIDLSASTRATDATGAEFPELTSPAP